MLIHHNLLGMLDSAEEKQQRYAATYKLFELAFPPTPVAKIWPAPAVAATTSAPPTPTTVMAAPAVVSLEPAAVSPEPAAGATVADASAGSSKKRSAAEALQDEQPAGSSSGSGSAPKDATLADAPLAAAPAEEDRDPRIAISVRACSGEAMLFSVRPHVRMSKVFNAYAANTEVQVTSLAFYLDGTRINEKDTVQELELKENDIIYAVLEQSGC
jgi:Ubiquitin-2 like Rad60 SUMO-like